MQPEKTVRVGLCPSLDEAAALYRLRYPAQALKNLGYLFKYLGGYRKQDFDSLDTVVFHESYPAAVNIEKYIAEALAKGLTVVYDFSNPVFLKGDWSFLRKVTIVTCATKEMVEPLSKYSPRVKCILSGLPKVKTPRFKYKAVQEGLVIGWAGTVDDEENLFLIIPALEQLLSKTNRVTMHIAGSVPVCLVKLNQRLGGKRIIFTKQVKAVSRWDLALIPILEHNAKSAVWDHQFLEYARAGVMSAVSNSQYFAGLPIGVVKTLATLGDWKEFLQAFVQDATLRWQFTPKAYNYVNTARLIETVAEDWKWVYNGGMA